MNLQPHFVQKYSKLGIFVFSTITAAISSYLTDRLLEDEDKENTNDIKSTFQSSSENIIKELKTIREENKDLKDGIDKLNDELNELKESINKK